MKDGEPAPKGQPNVPVTKGPAKPPSEVVGAPPNLGSRHPSPTTEILPGIGIFGLHADKRHRVYIRIAPSDWTLYRRRIDIHVRAGMTIVAPDGEPTHTLGMGTDTQNGWYILPAGQDASYFLSGLWFHEGWWRPGAIAVSTDVCEHGVRYDISWAHAGHQVEEFKQFKVQVIVHRGE